MNNEPKEIHQIEANGQEIDRNKYRVLYKPRIEGSREIFADGQQYMRRSDGSLVRITEKKLSKKERRKLRKMKNENNSII